MQDQRAPVETGKILVVAVDEYNGALAGQTTTRLRGEPLTESYDFTELSYDLHEFCAFLGRTLQQGHQQGTDSTVVALHGDIQNPPHYVGAAASQQLLNTPHVRNDAEDGIDVVSCVRAQSDEIDQLFRYRPIFRLVAYGDLVAHAAAVHAPGHTVVAGLDIGRHSLTGGVVYNEHNTFRKVYLPGSVGTITDPAWPQTLGNNESMELGHEKPISPHRLAEAAARLGMAAKAEVAVISWDSDKQKLDQESCMAAGDELKKSDSLLASYMPELKFVRKQGLTDPYLLSGGGGVLLDSLITNSVA